MNAIKRCIFSNSLITRVFKDKRNNISVRFLYNEQFLGIDKYVEARQRTISRLGNMKDQFYNRMNSQLNSSVPSMIFTEDLKTVFHTCEDKPAEIDLCIHMMKRFHKNNKELRFGTFVCGPVGMRLFYYLKKQDLIMSFFKDPELEGFFDQLKSYLLSMDLYFKNGAYQEIIDMFKVLKEKQLAETKFPRDAMVLTTGACYKINTPETYKMAADLVIEARGAKVPILRRALAFVVALALNQNEPHVAFELLSSIDRFNNSTGNNLRLMALAALGRINDAFDILRRATDQDAPTGSRINGNICQSSLDALQKVVEQHGDTETSHIFEQLCRSLKESNSITSQTIDNLVCLPIEPRILRDGFNSPFGSRSRFPEQGFRAQERQYFDREQDFPRRRRFAGLADD